MTDKASPLEIALYVVGAICGIFAAFKAYVSGFYESDVPVLVGAALIAAGSLLVASRLSQRRKQMRLASEDQRRGL